MDQELDVSGGTGQRGGHRSHYAGSGGGQRGRDPFQRAQPECGVAHHALPLGHGRPARLELGLDQEHEVRSRGGHRSAQRGQHRAQRNERQVGHHQRARDEAGVGLLQPVDGEGADVHPLEHHDPVVRPQAGVELPVAHVHGIDAQRTPLQQAVREAAGRGAGVEGAAALGHDVEAVQGGLELQAAPAHEGRGRAQQQHRLVRSDQPGRLVGRRPGHEHAPGGNGGLGLLAGPGQSPAHELVVEPAAGRWGQLAFFGAVFVSDTASSVSLAFSAFSLLSFCALSFLCPSL